MTSFADLEQRMVETCYRRFSNVRITRAIGIEFDAHIERAEPDVFGDSARMTTHTLSYPAGHELAANDLLTIAAGVYAGDYKVVGQPLRINGSEYQANLVKVAA